MGTNLERVALLEQKRRRARTKGPGASKILDTIIGLLLDSERVFMAMSERKNEKENTTEEENATDSRQRPELARSNKSAGEVFVVGKARAKNMAEGGSRAVSAFENVASASEIAYFEEHSGISGEHRDEEILKEFSSLINIFEYRLKSCLKESLRTTTAKTVSSSQKQVVLKRMFEVTLRASIANTNISDVRKLSEKVVNMLGTLRKTLLYTE